MTELLKSISEVRQWVGARRHEGQSIGLVPTMGALHRGHLALVKEAQRQASAVVVSIFVNPLQFGPTEDLGRYPRTIGQDLAQLEALSTDVVLMPEVSEMYPDEVSLTRVTVTEMSSQLCGKTRPTHFAGVTTVVAKLLNIVQPDIAVFGEKDWQQLAVIRRMVRDLNVPVTIVGVSTVREDSGLALSSRNQYLSAAERDQAVALFRSLKEAERRYNQGERDHDRLVSAVRRVLDDAGLTPEYVELVHPDSLRPAPSRLSGPALLALAVRVGKARLIDNVILGRS